MYLALLINILQLSLIAYIDRARFTQSLQYAYLGRPLKKQVFHNCTNVVEAYKF